MACVKALAESGVTDIPTNFLWTTDPFGNKVALQGEDSIPIIDFSALTSTTPENRSKVIQELASACQEWGFFMVINHGVSESLMNSMVDACKGFFSLPEEDKKQYKSDKVVAPIRCGSSSNSSNKDVSFWRDFLKLFVYPELHSPDKPSEFREIAKKYSGEIREVARELLKGISESLGLEPDHIEKVVNYESGLQTLVANSYPPCPQPELTMGVPPHTDHGLLTLLIQNQMGGLQIPHNGRWVHVDPVPNSILVNTGDHIEVLSNGKYKSVWHRALVNNKAERISIALFHGPSLETVVNPVPELLSREQQQPAYKAIKYKEFLELQQSKKYGDCCLDGLRIQYD